MRRLFYLIVIFMVFLSVLTIMGKEQITTEIVINAPVNKVWKQLTDFRSYPKWNPFLIKATGELKLGNTISVTFKSNNEKTMVFTPVIKQLEKNKILQWKGMLLFSGIFTGIHTFTLTKLAANKTKLIQQEKFHGVLVPMFDFKSTLDGFNAMNKALKKRLEKK